MLVKAEILKQFMFLDEGTRIGFLEELKEVIGGEGVKEDTMSFDGLETMFVEELGFWKNRTNSPEGEEIVEKSLKILYREEETLHPLLKRSIRIRLIKYMENPSKQYASRLARLSNPMLTLMSSLYPSKTYEQKALADRIGTSSLHIANSKGGNCTLMKVLNIIKREGG